jgi:hypothetical protein
MIGVDLCDALFGAALCVCWEVGHALDGVGLGVGHGEEVDSRGDSVQVYLTWEGTRCRGSGSGKGSESRVGGSGESVRQWNEYTTLSLRDVVQYFGW